MWDPRTQELLQKRLNEVVKDDSLSREESEINLWELEQEYQEWLLWQLGQENPEDF